MQAFFFLGFKMAKSLQDWISFLDSIDINKIKLGLERMQEMLQPSLSQANLNIVQIKIWKKILSLLNWIYYDLPYMIL